MERRRKKSLQALSYLANKTDDKSINRMKAIKLLWIADKYHLLKYGRTILKDNYHALPHGPVCSDTKDISHCTEEYVCEYIEKSGQHAIKALKDFDASLFSKTDLEVLDLVWKEFGKFDQFKLEKITHEYPEWKKFEDRLNDANRPNSYKMNLNDFFNLPEPTGKNMASFFHSIPKEMIEESKATIGLRKKFEQV
ncbi:MAG: SocA family protein [Bacteroidetes bacterium]|nr:SocA family protein [Bacteroidota bacterium]